MEELRKELAQYGYVDNIESKKNGLFINEKDILLLPDSLFFVDMGYRVEHTYLFAISAPKYGIKGILKLELLAYHALASSIFSEKFNIEIEISWEKVVICRQYGMRKILKTEFNPSIHVLKKGFPDFPPCPFGHTFKSLGYDTQTEEYVRFVSSILKDKSLKIVEYKKEK